MSRKSSMEGILFQFNNPFGKEMEAVFQDAINYTNSIDYSEISESRWTKHRYTLVHSYAKTTLFPALAKVIHKNTNLRVRKMVDVRSFSGMFAIDVSVDDWKDTATVMERYSGSGSDNGSVTDGVREIVHLKEKLDPKTGKLMATTLKNGKPITIKLYMDVDAAFLLHDNVNEKLVDNLTAGELAAIYLHEVGHFITMIESSANMYQTFEHSKKHLANIRLKNNSSSPNDIVSSYTKQVRPMIEKAVKKDGLNAKFLEAGDSIVKLANYTNKQSKSNFIINFIGQVLMFLANIYLVFIIAFLRAYMDYFLYPILATVRWFLSDKPGEHAKTTDQSVSDSVYYHIERMADDYVVKYGYGSELVSAFGKLNSLSRTMSVPFQNHRTPWIFTKSYVVLSEIFRNNINVFSGDYFPNKDYEGTTARMERALLATYGAFKKDMPSEVMHDYFADIDQMKKTIKANKSNIVKRASDAIWTYLLDLPMIVKRICQNDDMEEMERWLTKTDALIDNELYAISAKFQHMAK